MHDNTSRLQHMLVTAHTGLTRTYGDKYYINTI